MMQLTAVMNRRIRHRGPDGEGFVAFTESGCHVLGSEETPEENFHRNLPYSPVSHIEAAGLEDCRVVFGHRRLRIIDLSAEGHQPISDKEGRYWITFNGEVYNYKELRPELEKAGHTFFSQTDTEVVLHAYMEWGPDCVKRFIGMWAFAIYDRQQRKLFASRDKIGVKPFYYTFDDKYFAFASELKALRTLPFVPNALNDTAVYDYLVLGKCEMEEESIYQGILELQPGHSLMLDLAGHLEKQMYYTPRFYDEWEPYRQEKNELLVSRLRDLLQDSIDLHLRSDVKVGACLSGGLDSSIIAALASMRKKNLPVFTVTSKGDKEDESAWAEKVANYLHLPWQTTNPEPADLLQNFEELLYYQDMPALSANTYTHYELMRLVSQSGVRVTIDGQGADELFAGYTQYYAVFMADALRHGDIKTIMKALGEQGNDFANKKLALTIPVKKLFSGLAGEHLTAKAYRNNHPEFDFIEPSFWNEHANRILQLREKVLGSLNSTLFRDFHGNALKTMLRAADRNSMHFSIESRVPFSDDYRIEEFAFSLAAAYKVRDNMGKSLLRDAATQWLPNEICYRKDKKGFSIPEKRWMIEIGNEAIEYFGNELEPYLNVQKIRKEWSSTLINTPSTVRLWRQLCFAVWIKALKQ